MKSIFKSKKKFTSDEVSVFCEQIAMLLNGGIPLYEGIYMLYSEMEENRTKKLLRILDERVKEGASFFQALEETKAFPEYMIRMVRIGETTGKLEEVMRSLSVYYERESSMEAGIRSAVTYPVVLFSMMGVILLVLVLKILPLFDGMFQELSKDAAVTTQNGISAGIFFGKLMLSLTGVIIILILSHRTKTGKRMIKAVISRMTLTARLSELMATGKFISSMAIMFSSGVDMGQAMELTSAVEENKTVSKKITNCKNMVKEGMPLDGALRESKIVVGMEGRMVSVAAKSGTSDVMLSKLGEQYDKKITMEFDKMTTYLETGLIVILSLMIGGILITVMLPLVNMISSIG